MSNKKQAGIWLDNQHAIIAKNHGPQKSGDFFLTSPVKAEHVYSNSNENAENNQAQKAKNNFFKDIEKLLINTEELYITGPGTAQEQLKNHLAEQAQFKNLKVTLDTADKMSENQVLDTVKKHFNA